MKTSQQIHEDARLILEDTQIMDVLNNFGTAHIIGSYASNLMWDPDIDIVVVTDNPQEAAIQAINDLARIEKFQKLEFGDFKNYPKADRPESFIVNARKDWNGQIWEIETWFMKELGEAIKIVEKLKNLSSQEKKTIIERKQQRSISEISKHDLSSWEIYQDYV